MAGVGQTAENQADLVSLRKPFGAGGLYRNSRVADHDTSSRGLVTNYPAIVRGAEYA